MHGKGFKPWADTHWQLTVSNELFYCSHLDNLSGSWATPRIRWFTPSGN